MSSTPAADSSASAPADPGGSVSAPEQDANLPFDTDEIPGVKAALTRYRVMAYVVGVLLVILVVIGMPLKYLGGDDRVVTWTAIPHGWLYMVLIITAVDLGRRVGWPLTRLILIALAGTVPFLSFVAEHYARKDVQATIARVRASSGGQVEDRPAVG